MSPAQTSLAVLLLLLGCSGLPRGGMDAGPQTDPDICLDQEIARIDQLPEQDYLDTLDGRRVPLAPFFRQCRRLGLNCALYPKFYHWRNEIVETRSQSTDGMVTHRMRVYYNPVSVCFPDRVNPGRTHGDVGEFYDAQGGFLGLGVYMGEGLYVPLPHTGHPRSPVKALPLNPQ